MFELLHECVTDGNESCYGLTFSLPGSLSRLDRKLQSDVLALCLQLLVQLNFPPMICKLSRRIVLRQLYLKQISLSSDRLDDGEGSNRGTYQRLNRTIPHCDPCAARYPERFTTDNQIHSGIIRASYNHP